MACFMKGQIQLCRKKPTHSDSVNEFSETGIIKMIDGFIDNLFAMFDRRVYQQKVGIHVAINCAPILVDLFLHSHEAVFMRQLLL
jgi:hypothetical protein